MDAQIKQNDDVYIGFNLFELIAAEFSEGYEKEWREQLLDVGKVSVVCTLDEIVESFSSTKDIISTGDRLGLGVELLWEELHARCWSETLPVLRSLYGKICTLQILTLLLNVQVSPSLSSMSHQYAEKFAVELNRLADLGILLGDEQSRGQLLHILDVVIPSFAMKTIGVVNHRKSNTHIAHNRKRAREHLENSLIELPSSSIPLPAVHIVEDLDLTTFYEEYMIHQKPVLLTSSELIQQWPAMQTSGDCDVHKWADVNYLLAVCGNRTVPVELGDSYLASDATSSLMTVRRFIEQHLLQPSKESTTDRAYLAQHELFDQIPKLKEDIIVPDFCSLLLDVDEDENEENEENEEEGGDRKEDPGKVAINAWLGPCTTHSPLHYDCYYNILVQTVGYKYFRLYPAHVSQHLYPMTGKMCNNSSINVLDKCKYDKFPNLRLADQTAVEGILGPGECLFIPRHYWHYIQAVDRDTAHAFLEQQQPKMNSFPHHQSVPRSFLQKYANTSQIPDVEFSFSVSFWWGKRIPLSHAFN